MKNVVIAFVSSFLISSVTSAHAAELYESRIANVDRDAGITLVYLENDGRVLRIPQVGNETTIRELEDAYRLGDNVSVSVEEEGNQDLVQILGREAAPASVEASLPFQRSGSEDFDDGYQASDFGTVENLQSWFYRLEYDMKQKSQCYQRAHNWAWMMWHLGGLKTQKTFIFFTKRYIREYAYKWWFHVAPVGLVQGQMLMMDRSFTNKAIPVQNWTQLYMKNGANCPVVENYSEYSQKQEAQYCYLMFAPMYYYQPLNLEQREGGAVVKEFQTWELRNMLDALDGPAYRKWKRAGLFDLFL